MITEDVYLPLDASWILVPISGAEQLVVQNAYNEECLFRFGAGSTSVGIVLHMGHTVIAEEDIYIRLKVGAPKATPLNGSLRVSR